MQQQRVRKIRRAASDDTTEPAAGSARLLLSCAGLALLLWAVSRPLHCAQQAAWVGLSAWAFGMLLGVFLALITRTRRPILIYLYLACAALTLLPLYREWPAGDMQDVTPLPGVPLSVYYFVLFRPVVFLLAVPFPFARLGQHGPDPIAPAPDARAISISGEEQAANVRP